MENPEIERFAKENGNSATHRSETMKRPAQKRNEEQRRRQTNEKKKQNTRNESRKCLALYPQEFYINGEEDRKKNLLNNIQFSSFAFLFGFRIKLRTGSV